MIIVLNVNYSKFGIIILEVINIFNILCTNKGMHFKLFHLQLNIILTELAHFLITNELFKKSCFVD